MGAVYLAEQCEPIHRKVALKVIKPGLDSRSICPVSITNVRIWRS